jgi:hypothetical protein
MLGWHRHAEHRKRRVRGDDAGEVRRTACRRDDRLHAARFRAFAHSATAFRRTVRGHRLGFVGHAELAEHLRRGLHRLPVGGRTHHDADERAHFKPFPVSRSSASRYLAEVFAITSAGSFGAGGVLFQSSVSR